MSTLCEIDGSQLSGKAIYSKLHLNSEYECLLCHKNFQTKQYLQRHQKTVHIQQGISYDECEKHFTKKADLKRHKNTVHEKKIIDAGDAGAKYPVLFPEETITRKQHVLSFVFPKYIREGNVYKYLKIEHAGENIHCKYNRLEAKHKNQKHRGKRFFLIIRDYKEEMHTDKTKFKKNNRFRRRL